MKFGERILLACSRKPGSADLITDASAGHISDDTALSLLERVYPDLDDIIAGKSVMDFGCGYGHQSVALAKRGASQVVGVDSNPNTLAVAKEMLLGTDVQERVQFVDALSEDAVGQLDVCISQNSMEHFPDPEVVIKLMLKALKPDGKLLITFGPPWYAPYGSHMHFFTKIPWVNIWFSESTVMGVRSLFRNDGATHYEEVESGLNKMTVRKFERIVRESSLPCKIVYRKYECVKGADFLSKIPLFREMFITHVTCTLQKCAP
jgi:SAM-dependent methyltransferase